MCVRCGTGRIARCDSPDNHAEPISDDTPRPWTFSVEHTLTFTVPLSVNAAIALGLKPLDEQLQFLGAQGSLLGEQVEAVRGWYNDEEDDDE
jgi:hypothetical protein